MVFASSHFSNILFPCASFVSSLCSSLGYETFRYHLLWFLSVSPVSHVCLLPVTVSHVLVLLSVFVTSCFIFRVPHLMCFVFNFVSNRI